MGVRNLYPLLWLAFFLIFSDGDDAPTSTYPPQLPPPGGSSRIAPLKPGISIIVGVLTTIFSITFLLLLYVKHCKREVYVGGSRGHPPSRSHSGINRKVIESLPMFRFSSLRGQKDGLECAVCLNKFEAEEILRLLPKCKHAFHVECVDTWLDAHSTCPLCRYRVDPEDVLLLVDVQDSRSLFNSQDIPRSSDNPGKPTASPTLQNGTPRISGRHSSAAEKARSMEIIVENPGAFPGRVSLDSWKSRKSFMRRTASEVGKSAQSAENPVRRSLDSWKSFRKKPVPDSRKDGQLPISQKGEKHRVEHRIIISAGQEQQQRWSDVHPAELLYLKSEMLLSESGRAVINKRSVSEITGMSRCRSNDRDRQEEGAVKRWLAWISQSPQYKHQKPAVPSSSSSSPISIGVEH